MFDRAVELRRAGRFGEAVNAFMEAVAAAEKEMDSAVGLPERDCLQEIVKKSLASVELIQEINGFVNTDLMNP